MKKPHTARYEVERLACPVIIGRIAILGFLDIGGTDTQRERAYRLVILDVGIGAALYLVGFVAIAGGWFLLYSAPTPPNFTAAAAVFVSLLYGSRDLSNPYQALTTASGESGRTGER